MEALLGVEGLDSLVREKGIRWAASVYGGLPMLRPIAEGRSSSGYGLRMSLATLLVVSRQSMFFFF